MKKQWIWNLLFVCVLLYLAWSQVKIAGVHQKQISACVKTIGNIADLDSTQTTAILLLQKDEAEQARILSHFYWLDSLRHIRRHIR
jgi:hypothetical protein